MCTSIAIAFLALTFEISAREFDVLVLERLAI